MGKIRPIDLSGQRFGKLVCAAEAGRKGREVLWRLKCDCGGEVLRRTGEVRRDRGSRHCGCGVHDPRPSVTTHGHSRTKPTRTYYAWQSAKNRCHNPRKAAYKNYGARGILVCERWRNSFANFLADMGQCPDGLSLERIDNERGYEPGNCKWATALEQGGNRRGVRLVDGVPLKVYARNAGVRYTSFLKWYNTGMTPEAVVERIRETAVKPLPAPTP